MSEIKSINFGEIYAQFQAPVTALDCGQKCAPHNERGVPFCCDLHHAVPTAYQAEWEHLQENTRMWHLWEGEDAAETQSLRSQAPDGQVLIACQGHSLCQRGVRSLTCRAFPFYPYLTRQGEFLGLSYYWEYEDRCWVISHMEAVTPEYHRSFIATYDELFLQMPEERENFRYHSTSMRRIFGRKHRSIPLLHRNGFAYKITPHNGRMRRVAVSSLPKFGPYALADLLPFPDEAAPVSFVPLQAIHTTQ